MAVQILSRRSSVAFDRPFPVRLGTAELAVNFDSTDPGLYFADNTAAPATNLIKVGPTFIGSTPPNTPSAGFTSFSKGESWLDTSSTKIFKLHDGSTWQVPNAVASNSNGKPINPTDGQLHYDKLVPGLFMYDAGTASWIAV